MWSPGQLTRSPSHHSMAGSIASTHSSSYGEAIAEHPTAVDGEMLLSKKAMVLQSDLLQGRSRSKRTGSASTQNTISTLAMEPHEEEMNLKTPTEPKDFIDSTTISTAPDDASETPAPRMPAGPMEQLLRSLLRKVADAERSRPTIMTAEYEIVQQRVTKLEAENKTHAANYEALMAIRCEDLENLIKIRDQLAKERHEHDATKALREDDLANVYTLRDKLAQMTWAQPRSTSVGRMSIRQSRTEGDDLWQVAKTAALEHRIVELEQANKALQARVSTSGPSEMMSRVELMFEESLKYREKMASKIQQLRSEKEALQKEVSAQDDRNTELEVFTQKLQRNVRL